jgi:Mor family transcriptional regulator
MQEKRKRNLLIYQQKMAGSTYRELSITYGLSVNVLVTIVRREKERILRQEIESMKTEVN